MISLIYARTMGAYNRWMNERLYEACAGLADAERKRDRGAFFKSVHGTLNHLLYGDRAWMSRPDRGVGGAAGATDLPWLPELRQLTSAQGSTSPRH